MWNWLNKFFKKPQSVSLSDSDDFPVIEPDPTPVPVPEAATWKKSEEEVLNKINKLRQDKKRKTLIKDQKLYEMAANWSAYQANMETLTHGNFARRINSVYPNAFAFENVGMEYGRDIFLEWCKSPMHMENMLSATTHVGLAMAVSVSGAKYWTVVFLRK